jgi:hypothetical protein
VAGLVAVVAAAVGTAVQAQGGAVSLDVAEALAVVALLGLGGTGQRAGARLVAGLLAVVAETLGGRADLSIVANSATLVACATRQHHSGDNLSIASQPGAGFMVDIAPSISSVFPSIADIVKFFA